MAVCFHWPVAAPAGVPRAVVLDEVLGLVEARYVEEVDTDELFHRGLDRMLRTLDPHSKFIAPREVEQFDADIQGTYDGIGIVFHFPEDGEGARIESVVPDSPAAAAGILPGDEIVSVDGVDVRGAAATRMRELLSGDRLTLELVRNGSPTYSVVVERQQIVQPSVEALRFYPDGEGDGGVGYLRLSQFQPGTSREVAKACHRLVATGATRLVIDLRNNRGGVLDEARDVCDLFLRDGLVLSTRGRANVDTPVLYRASADTAFPDVPLVVLIDGGSASAAEIVAAALQDLRRAVLVGDESFGKWTVQDVIPLPNRAGKVKLTTKRFHPPESRWVRRDAKGQRQGLLPQVEVPIDLPARSALVDFFGREARAHIGDPGRVDRKARPTLQTGGDATSADGPVDAPLVRALGILDRLDDYSALLVADPDPHRLGRSSESNPASRAASHDDDDDDDDGDENR